MLVKCPNCEEYLDFSGCALGKKTCPFCGCSVYAVEHNYNSSSHLQFSSVDTTPRFFLVNTISEMIESINFLSTSSFLSIDVETSGLDPYTAEILLLQIATEHDIYIFSKGVLAHASYLKDILENKSTRKILHNAKFDYKFIYLKLGICLSNIYDTMLSEAVLTAGKKQSLSLNSLTEKYLGKTLNKSIRESFIGRDSAVTQAQFVYAAEDVAVLYPIYIKQLHALQREGTLHIAELENQAVIPIAHMELNGVLIDTAAWNLIIQKLEDHLHYLTEELQSQLCNYEDQQTIDPSLNGFNYNSSSNIINLLSTLGFTVDDATEQTLRQINHPIVSLILEIRKYNKLTSTFGTGFLAHINPITGRIHASFMQCGTDTGRLSCNNPNLQQIPASSEFRSCFIAGSNKKIITCDYSQAELRILAQLSGDENLIDAFCSGQDLHKLTASRMFGIPLDSVTKELRGKAKAINFGLAYGMGPVALSEQLNVSREDAENLITKYFEAYPGISRWLDCAGKEAVKYGFSKTPLGRKRYFYSGHMHYDLNRSYFSSIERKGKNTPIQGTNADITKMALIAIHNNITKYNAKIINTVHDEIVVESPDVYAKTVESIMLEQMIISAKRVITVVPVLVDSKISDHWEK